jgi:hypothetical protein
MAVKTRWQQIRGRRDTPLPQLEIPARDAGENDDRHL